MEHLKLQLQIALKVQQFNYDWKKVSREIKDYSPKECQHIFYTIAPNMKLEEIIEMLSEQYKKELRIRLGKLEVEYRKLPHSYPALTRKQEKMDLEIKIPSDVDSTTSDDRKSNSWQKTANMIWQKIADHRAGNLFLKPIKDPNYTKIIKQPMFLETVKSRIRQKIITTTAEFYRDVMHVLANAVMYSPDDRELYQMAMELKQYTDSEMQSFLVLHPQE